MSNLEQIIEQIKSEISVNDLGQGKGSIRGTARLIDVHHGSIGKAFQSAGAANPHPLVKFLMQQGFTPAQIATFAEDGVPDIVIALCGEYYGYECPENYRREEAKAFCRAFRTIGIRKWMQQVVGWVPPSQQASITLSTKELLEIKEALLTTQKIASRFTEFLGTVKPTHPGLFNVVRTMSEPSYQLALPPADKQKLHTVDDFLTARNVSLPYPALCAFRNQVALSFRCLTFNPPAKVKNELNNWVNGYRDCDLPILDNSLVAVKQAFGE